MKIETMKSNTVEVFTEGHEVNVSATRWSNCEGVNVMILRKNQSFCTTFSLRWEELDVLMVALQAIRSE